MPRFAPFFQKNGFAFAEQILYFERWINVKCLLRFDLGFWRTSKPFYWKLQYMEKLLGKIQYLLCFTRKMVSYSLTKGGIRVLGTKIQWLRRFDLGFWQTSEQIGNSNMKRIFHEGLDLPCFLRKIVLHFLREFYIFALCIDIFSH